MGFPIIELMSSDACYRFLIDLLHPDGLRCPGCRRDDFYPHDRHRDPVLDYRCRNCGAVFNADTGTPFQKTHRSPGQLVLIPRGICQGTPTAQLARERDCDRKQLLLLRHKPRGSLSGRRASLARWRVRPPKPMRCSRTRGKKGLPHRDPEDPPRRRANQRRGHGTFENDRPAVAGVVSRQSGEVVLEVVERTDGPTGRR